MWSLPLHTLCQQAGCGQSGLDVVEPLGVLQLTEPAVHVVGLVPAGLHQFNETLLEGFTPG